MRIGNGRKEENPKANNTRPWKLLEVIFLASTPKIHSYPAYDVKACLFIHSSTLLLLFSYITLGCNIRSSSEAGNRPMGSPGKAPRGLVCGLALHGCLLKSMVLMGPKPPFRAQGARASGTALIRVVDRRTGLHPYLPPNFPSGSQKPET